MQKNKLYNFIYKNGRGEVKSKLVYITDVDSFNFNGFDFEHSETRKFRHDRVQGNMNEIKEYNKIDVANFSSKTIDSMIDDLVEDGLTVKYLADYDLIIAYSPKVVYNFVVHNCSLGFVVHGNRFTLHVNGNKLDVKCNNQILGVYEMSPVGLRGALNKLIERVGE
jgi:hypothetical protein